MASNRFDLIRDGKVSSLSAGTYTVDTADDHRKNYGTAGLSGRTAGKKSLFWVVDIVVILVIAALCALAYLYLIRPLMDNYRESWDEEELLCVLELRNVDPALVTYDRDGIPVLCGHPVWSGDSEDSDRLGDVLEAEPIAVVREDGSTVLTISLTVRVTARCRTGEGYRVGETRLLCGEERQYRLYGLSAEGVILSMKPVEEEE